MSDRAAMNEVKTRVRRAALTLCEFTVDDIARATGLNVRSIRTELQRMRKEGLLTSGPRLARPQARGGRPVVYRLAQDPEARLALSESIEGFYPPPPSSDCPTSRHYFQARDLINEAMAADRPDRERLASQARDCLEIAEQAEGGSLAPPLVKAHLEFERARLAYVAGQLSQAEGMFEALHEFFRDDQDETMAGRIEEFLLCLHAWVRFAARQPGEASTIEWARSLLQTIEGEAYRPTSPLAVQLLRAVRDLSQTTEERLVAAALDRLIEVSAEELRATAETIRAERMPWRPQTMKQQTGEPGSSPREEQRGGILRPHFRGQFRMDRLDEIGHTGRGHGA